MVEQNDSNSEELTMEPVAEPVSAGDLLREAREKQDLDLEHIAAKTRIPIRHLEAIESGQFDELPSRAYAIGFARTYARAVGIDDGEVTAKVREELAEGHARQSALAGGMEPGDPAKLPSASLAWSGGAAALILAVGIFFFYNTYFGAGTGPESLLVQAEQDAAREETLAAQAAADEASANAQASAPSGQVIFTATEDDVWVRFYEDPSNPFFEAVMESGDTFEVPGDAEAPLINTGRPDALAITIGGQEVPKLADEPVVMGDTPISASALLARADISDAGEPQVN
ncbi:RodZ domain-containing protein [Erythrobacter sp. MTPC3]|uniref:helix-turn-helix domain-containing protein n=1 Tax=Erythrobacter sp. MTPC3 TaxID=3056564 RepID=UPI0036F2B0AD